MSHGRLPEFHSPFAGGASGIRSALSPGRIPTSDPGHTRTLRSSRSRGLSKTPSSLYTRLHNCWGPKGPYPPAWGLSGNWSPVYNCLNYWSASLTPNFSINISCNLYKSLVSSMDSFPSIMYCIWSDTISDNICMNTTCGAVCIWRFLTSA